MDIYGVDSSSNINFDLFTNSYKKQNDYTERSSQDTVSISEEAQVLFMQSQQLDQASSDGNTGQDDEGSATAQEFKDMLNSHKSGSGSSQSSSEDAIEDVESKISQVTSELASIASKGIESEGGVNSSRVEQLQSQLSQLESLLAELQAAEAEETAG